jgi:hypothetical protein
MNALLATMAATSMQPVQTLKVEELAPAKSVLKAMERTARSMKILMNALQAPMIVTIAVSASIHPMVGVASVLQGQAGMDVCPAQDVRISMNARPANITAMRTPRVQTPTSATPAHATQDSSETVSTART